MPQGLFQLSCGPACLNWQLFARNKHRHVESMQNIGSVIWQQHTVIPAYFKLAVSWTEFLENSNNAGLNALRKPNILNVCFEKCRFQNNLIRITQSDCTFWNPCWIIKQNSHWIRSGTWTHVDTPWIFAILAQSQPSPFPAVGGGVLLTSTLTAYLTPTHA